MYNNNKNHGQRVRETERRRERLSEIDKWVSVRFWLICGFFPSFFWFPLCDDANAQRYQYPDCIKIQFVHVCLWLFVCLSCLSVVVCVSCVIVAVLRFCLCLWLLCVLGFVLCCVCVSIDSFVRLIGLNWTECEAIATAGRLGNIWCVAEQQCRMILLCVSER